MKFFTASLLAVASATGFCTPACEAETQECRSEGMLCFTKEPVQGDLPANCGEHGVTLSNPAKEEEKKQIKEKCHAIAGCEFKTTDNTCAAVTDLVTMKNKVCACADKGSASRNLAVAGLAMVAALAL